MEEVFGNFLDLRACAHTFLESLSVRQREENPIIKHIADVFYNAMRTLRRPYPIYAAQLPAAEKRLKDEIDNNPEFRLWLEERYRLVPKSQASRCLTLKHFLTRPSEHMGKYPVLLQALEKETVEDSFEPDRAKERDNLQKAIVTANRLSTLAQLRTWQKDMMRNEPYKSWQWPNVAGEEERNKVDKVQYKWNLYVFHYSFCFWGHR
jgi:RHO1 GDP-GTP exchange protein 1/2